MNTKNFYTGSIYMGQNAVQIDSIIYDTGSPWMILPTVDCVDCTTTTYNYT